MKAISILLLLVVLGCSSSSDPAPTPDPPEPITDFDGNEYDTVRLGTQVWLTTDLKTRHFLDGSPVVSFSTYFYAWGAVVNTKKICPNGYKVPSDNDFDVLVDHLGNSAPAVILALTPAFRGYFDASGTQFPDGVAYYWTTTEFNADGAWSYQLVTGQPIIRSAYGKIHGLCVRCLKE